MTGRIDRDRIDAHGKLLTAIGEELDAGQRVPCLSNPSRWESENADEQEAAAHGCQSCAALEACTRYVTAFPERAGTWAGLTPTQQTKANRKANQ